MSWFPSYKPQNLDDDYSSIEEFSSDLEGWCINSKKIKLKEEVEQVTQQQVIQQEVIENKRFNAEEESKEEETEILEDIEEFSSDIEARNQNNNKLKVMNVDSLNQQFNISNDSIEYNSISETFEEQDSILQGLDFNDKVQDPLPEEQNKEMEIFETACISDFIHESYVKILNAEKQNDPQLAIDVFTKNNKEEKVYFSNEKNSLAFRCQKVYQECEMDHKLFDYLRFTKDFNPKQSIKVKIISIENQPQTKDLNLFEENVINFNIVLTEIIQLHDTSNNNSKQHQLQIGQQIIVILINSFIDFEIKDYTKLKLIELKNQLLKEDSYLNIYHPFFIKDWKLNHIKECPVVITYKFNLSSDKIERRRIVVNNLSKAITETTSKVTGTIAVGAHLLSKQDVVPMIPKAEEKVNPDQDKI
ncbi:hypothetical protein K502DRAFT_365638 [Neoconidiobolus thromboides FSU 785]|nr:hypothetical protein K502DRAFT_365638 [Neoconidiobolus thromboides FSU 785]